jgi:hypothetical protein
LGCAYILNQRDGDRGGEDQALLQCDLHANE